jgi:chromosomal replication initiator protein
MANNRYRFDNFIVGSANRLAVAAARAVAESPGSAYNPLFIYSGSGLGKTHLMGAIAHHAASVQPTLKLDYLSLDEFVRQLHAAVSIGQAENFRQRYQHVDLLLLDDVQFLTGRRETQSEMLRLFNALQGAGRQIVMTSDRPPSDIADVDERLLNRLAGGLIVDIGAPDYETRVAILRSKCEEREVRFATGVIEALAKMTFGNVRELQGALNRLIAHQTLEEGELTVDDVAMLLGGTTTTRSTVERDNSGEYLAFLTGVQRVVSENAWRVRLGEGIAYWRGEGYRTGPLDRLFEGRVEPDVERVLTEFSTSIDRLRALEAEATNVDASLGGADVFRDPDRLSQAEALVAKAQAGEVAPDGPSPAFTRDEYEVGAANQLAVRAADAIIADPGRRYNPYFIHGPSGVGKTHLMHAIGNGIAGSTCLGAQQFVDSLIAALQEGTVERWRARFRAAGALLIDDVHFLAGKERTQEELFHVFNDMYDQGKQVVLSSDRPPKELEDLEERLRSRFEGGLVVAIQPPDRGLREKLYARFLARADIEPEPALVMYLADRPVASVREIAGTIQRLMATAEVAGAAVSLDLAHNELDGPGSARVPAPKEMAVDAFFLDDEKVIWDWPEMSGRVIEEWR